jgi:hypothetical protein
MEHADQDQALSSDDAFNNWKQAIEDTVATAMVRRPTTKTPIPVSEESHSTWIEEPATEKDEDDVNNQAWNLDHYTGELHIDRDVNPTYTVQVCQKLRAIPHAEIISIDHSSTNTTVRCTVLDPASLLDTLDRHTEISSWVLKASWFRASNQL